MLPPDDKTTVKEKELNSQEEEKVRSPLSTSRPPECLKEDHKLQTEEYLLQVI